MCETGVCVCGVEAMRACVRCGGMTGRVAKAQFHVDMHANRMMNTSVVVNTHVRM